MSTNQKDPVMTTRPTAKITDPDGNPVDRDEYADHLATQAVRLPKEDRVAVLSEGEALSAAALLDELSGVYPDEPLGDLARDLAVRLFDRVGV